MDVQAGSERPDANGEQRSMAAKTPVNVTLTPEISDHNLLHGVSDIDSNPRANFRDYSERFSVARSTSSSGEGPLKITGVQTPNLSKKKLLRDDSVFRLSFNVPFKGLLQSPGKTDRRPAVEEPAKQTALKALRLLPLGPPKKRTNKKGRDVIIRSTHLDDYANILADDRLSKTDRTEYRIMRDVVHIPTVTSRAERFLTNRGKAKSELASYEEPDTSSHFLEELFRQHREASERCLLGPTEKETEQHRIRKIRLKIEESKDDDDHHEDNFSRSPYRCNLIKFDHIFCKELADERQDDNPSSQEQDGEEKHSRDQSEDTNDRMNDDCNSLQDISEENYLKPDSRNNNKTNRFTHRGPKPFDPLQNYGFEWLNE